MAASEPKKFDSKLLPARREPDNAPVVLMATPLMNAEDMQQFLTMLTSENGQSMSDRQICENIGVNFISFLATTNNPTAADFTCMVQQLRQSYRTELIDDGVRKMAQIMRCDPEVSMTDVAIMIKTVQGLQGEAPKAKKGKVFDAPQRSRITQHSGEEAEGSHRLPDSSGPSQRGAFDISEDVFSGHPEGNDGDVAGDSPSSGSNSV